VITIETLKADDYWTQRKNSGSPLVECQVTSAANWLNAQGIYPDTNGKRLPDFIDDLCQSDHARAMAAAERWSGNPRELHSVLKWAIDTAAGRELDDFQTQVPMRQIVFDVAHRKPVIVAGTFGPYQHVVCWSGLVTAQSDIEQTEEIAQVDLSLVVSARIADPFGNLHTDYRDAQGYGCLFTMAELTQILHAEGSNLKWAHRRIG